MSWTATSTWGRWIAVGAGAGSLGLGVVGVVAPSALALALVPTALAFVGVGLAFTRIEVTVTETQLRTAFGPARWPVVALPLAEIERLEHVADLRPVRYGGWGYRGSLRLLKKAAVILRRGDGVIFALTGERRFIVTVDDAESLARTVQERIRR